MRTILAVQTPTHIIGCNPIYEHINVVIVIFSWKTLEILHISKTVRTCHTGTVFTFSWSQCPLWVGLLSWYKVLSEIKLNILGYGDVVCVTACGRGFQV